MSEVGGSDIENNGIVAAVRIALPLILNNKNTISNKIRQAAKRFKICESTIDATIYFTMYADFKSDYPLESVNQYLCKTLRNKDQRRKQQHVKFNNTVFSIYYDFTYTQLFYAASESLDYDFAEDEDEIMIPSVVGLSVYLFPEKVEPKEGILDGYNLIEYIKKEFLNKYNVKQMQSFMYLASNDENFEKLFASLADKMKPDVHIRNISHKSDEIKLKLDALIASSIGKVL